MATVASVTNHWITGKEGFTTTLASTISAGAATVPLNSVSGYSNGDQVAFVIEPTDASKKQVFTGVIDTAGVQVTGVVWTEGTDQTHTAGSTVVDYWTATHQAALVKGLKVSHNQDGTMITSLPLTTPKITTSINDANGNEVIKTPATSSAVNEVTVTNAATGTAVGISATGGDTNIDLSVSSKGTGKVVFTGLSTWQSGSGTWTYVSSTTFTVQAADAALMTVGTKIWITQTTSKYFCVTGISGTTITVNGGSDYTVANAAITAPYFSNDDNPYGFPHAFNYTPSWTNLTIGNGTQSSKFWMRGNTVFQKIHVLFGTTTSIGGSVTLSPVVTPNSIYSSTKYNRVGNVWLVDEGAAVYDGALDLNSSTTAITITTLNAAGTYSARTAISSTVPHTWASTDAIAGLAIYEAA